MRYRDEPRPLRWRRKALADLWDVSDRTIDRMRVDGRLGEPVGYIGRRTPSGQTSSASLLSAH